MARTVGLAVGIFAYIVYSLVYISTALTTPGTYTVYFNDTNTPCNQSVPDTCKDNPNSECDKVNGTETLRCVCKDGRQIFGKSCLRQSMVGETCATGVTACISNNTECRDDGRNYDTWRCNCIDGYSQKKTNDTQAPKECVKTITIKDVPACELCEKNEGTCYTRSGVDPLTMDGCICPTTQKGYNCTEKLVDVVCTASPLKMRVCYKPDPADGVDFTTNGSAMMYTNGKFYDIACRAKYLTANDTVSACQEGEVLLVVDLLDGTKNRCGVEEYQVDLHKKKFQVDIMVEPDPKDSGKTFSFSTYCGFTGSGEWTVPGLGVVMAPGNNRGKHSDPDLDLKVFHRNGQEIQPGVALRTGDKIRFQLEVELDGIYDAIQVLSLTASSSAVIGDPKATTQALTKDGCPAQGQSIINQQNLFKREGTSSNILKSGLVEVFTLGQGNVVFIQLRIKVCLVGQPAACLPINCTAIAAGSRKKRATDSEQVDLSQEIIIFDEGDRIASAESVVINRVDFALLLTVLVILLVLFILLTVCLYLRLRGRGASVEDNIGLAHKPQRFALPRINTPSMRM